jgi:hypothetical protein
MFSLATFFSQQEESVEKTLLFFKCLSEVQKDSIKVKSEPGVQVTIRTRSQTITITITITMFNHSTVSVKAVPQNTQDEPRLSPSEGKALDYRKVRTKALERYLKGPGRVLNREPYFFTKEFQAHYNCRSKYAQVRPRKGGRCVKADQAESEILQPPTKRRK